MPDTDADGVQPAEVSERPTLAERADDAAGKPRSSPGGGASVDEMSEWSFPASDPPATWTWDP